MNYLRPLHKAVKGIKEAEWTKCTEANPVRLLLAMCVNIDSIFSYLSENINSHPMPAISGILKLTRVVTKE